MVFYFTTLALLFFLSVILVISIMMQEGKSMGLGSLGNNWDPNRSLFGTSTPEVLRKFTANTAGIFLALCLFMSLWTNHLARTPEAPRTPTIEATSPLAR